MSAVLERDGWHQNLTWRTLNDILGIVHDFDSFEIPVFLVPVEALTLAFHLTELLGHVFNVYTHLLKEINNSLEASTTIETSAASIETKWSLLLSLWLILIFIVFLFWKDCDHHFRHVGWVFDLEEWVVMVESFFAICAVVKVLAN